jgi:hypothetical protein
LVAKLSVAWVVPTESTPLGRPFERSGGVVSTGTVTVRETTALPDEESASAARYVKASGPE